MNGEGRYDFEPLSLLKFIIAALWVGFLPVMLLAVGTSSQATLFIFLVFAAAIAVTNFLLWRWPCPRCQRRFCARYWFSKPNYFAKKCAHCGLPYVS